MGIPSLDIRSRGTHGVGVWRFAEGSRLARGRALRLWLGRRRLTEKATIGRGSP